MALASVEDAEPVLRVTGPGDAELAEWWPADYPGVLAALYVPALHADADADVGKDPAEVVVGAGPASLVWLPGPVPAGMEAAGFTEGWNARVSIDGGQGESVPLDAVPVEAGLWPADTVDSIHVGGAWTGEGSPEGLGLAVVPDLWSPAEGIDPAWEATEGFTDGSWEVVVADAPDSDHRDWREAYASDAALEYLMAWRDTQADGRLADGDTLVAGACLGEGSPAYLVYLPDTASLGIAWWLQSSDLHLGWLLVGEVGGTRILLDETAGLDLAMGESCLPALEAS